MNQDLLAKIKSRGFWRIVIRPARWQPERLPKIADCLNLVQRHRVNLRGWDFPHLEQDIARGTDFIGSATDNMHILEYWKFFQSGQIGFLDSFYEDWVNDSPWFKMGAPVSLEPGKGFDMLNALYRLSEAYEFAARLAQAGTYGDQAVIKIDLHGLSQRYLIFWPGSGRRLSGSYMSQVPQLTWTSTVSARELIGNARQLALDRLLWIIERFGWLDAPTSIFQKSQEEFFQGRIR